MELAAAMVVSTLLGIIDLGILRYRFYLRWIGRLRTRLSLVFLIAINAAAGAVGWWFAHWIAKAATSNAGQQLPPATGTSWWLLRGIAFGTMGYAILHAQIPRVTDRAGDAVSLLGKVKSLVLDLLIKDSERAVYQRVGKYADEDLARRSLELLYQHVNHDENLGELVQKKLATELRRRIKDINNSTDEKLLEAQVAVRDACANMIIEYEELPTEIDEAPPPTAIAP